MIRYFSSSPNLWQVIISVLGALFGVQSSKVRERDFTHGRWWAYVIVGIIAVVLIVLILMGLTKLILVFAGVK